MAKKENIHLWDEMVPISIAEKVAEEMCVSIKKSLFSGNKDYDKVLKELFAPSDDCDHVWKSALLSGYKCNKCKKQISINDIKKATQ